jgi:uncharacterized phage protein (TIGR02220 family)
MKNSNYYVIQGWMINELKLKGNSLLVYAIIHGFSQDGETMFEGSLKYLEKAINGSRNTVIKSLKELTEKRLITKDQVIMKNVTFNKYSSNWTGGTKIALPIQELTKGGSEIGPGGGAEIAPNKHILNKHINKTPVDSLFSENQVESLPKKVIRYLNEKKSSKKPFELTPTNLNHVESRIKEGFKLQDFKTVIDFKIDEWSNEEKMKKYIRPETLFGSKFNGYLVASEHHKPSNIGSGNFEFNPQKTAKML